jgi:hypothetical protein
MDKLKEFFSRHKKAMIIGASVIVGLILFLFIRGKSSGSGSVADVGGYGGVTLGTPIGTGNTIPSADTGSTQYPGGTSTGDNSGAGTQIPSPPVTGTTSPATTKLSSPIKIDDPVNKTRDKIKKLISSANGTVYDSTSRGGAVIETNSKKVVNLAVRSQTGDVTLKRPGRGKQRFHSL